MLLGGRRNPLQRPGPAGAPDRWREGPTRVFFSEPTQLGRGMQTVLYEHIMGPVLASGVEVDDDAMPAFGHEEVCFEAIAQPFRTYAGDAEMSAGGVGKRT